MGQSGFVAKPIDPLPSKNWPLSPKIGHNESNAGSRSESAFELECEDPLKRNRFVKHSQIKQSSTE